MIFAFFCGYVCETNSEKYLGILTRVTVVTEHTKWRKKSPFRSQQIEDGCHDDILMSPGAFGKHADETATRMNNTCSLLI